MFVHAAGRRYGSFVFEECEREEDGLVNQAFAAAIKSALALQLLDEFAPEPADRALPAQQFVVEVEHRADESRAQTEWRLPHSWPRRGRLGGDGHQDFTFDGAQQPWRGRPHVG